MSSQDRLPASAAEPAFVGGPPPGVPLYHHALRSERSRWWKGALAIVSFVALFLIANVLFSIAAVAFDIVTGTTDPNEMAQIARLTPALMLSNNLALAASVPIAMLLQWAFFGVRPRWLSSVEGGFRWRVLARMAMLIVPIWAIYIGGSFLLEPLPGDLALDGTAIAMLIIVVLTTPLQAAGEEYGARGLLLRSAGSWFADSRVAFAAGAIVSSIFFAIAHFAGDPWLIAYYLVFGVAMCIAATGTGGLEAPVVIHAVNNVFLLLPTMLAGQQDSIFERQEGTGGPFMLLPMAIVLAAAVLVSWYARRKGIQNRGIAPYGAGVTEAPPVPASTQN